MSTVTVTVLHSDTERDVWSFRVLDYPVAYLDHYARETRPSTRHRKWTAQRSWHRLGISRYAYGEHLAVEPDVPHEVLGDALAALRAQVHIERWSERHGRRERSKESQG